MQNVHKLKYLGLVVLSILCGLGISLSLGLAKQKWATTYYHSI